MHNISYLIDTLQESIFSWDYFSNFKKIKQNTFEIKVQLNILNSLLGEKDIEEKFLSILKEYPETRQVLPILIAVRGWDKNILDRDTLEITEVFHLFKKDSNFGDEEMLKFFRSSGLKEVFENQYISSLNDYVFGVETGLDSNARKNRTGSLMEELVETFVKDICKNRSGLEYREQATVSYMKNEWGIEVQSDKSSRRFDFAIFDKNINKVFLIEVNYYGGGGSKLKAVAGEFAGLYGYMKKQDVSFYWITDGLGWNTAVKPLEDAYNKMEGNIYNIEMLKEGILEELIK